MSKSDDHWIPYYLYCTPCLLHYEFIAKTETLGPDQTYVIRALGLNEKIKARWRHKTQFTDSGSQLVRTRYFFFYFLAMYEIDRARKYCFICHEFYHTREMCNMAGKLL